MPPTEDTSPAAAEIGPDELADALVSVGNALSAITARSISSVRDDLSPAQFRALAELEHEPRRRVVDLALALGVNRSTATRMSDRLARKRLVTRTRQRGDRRTVRLSLTDAGRELLHEASQSRRLAVSEIVSRLPDGDRRSLAVSLRAFAEASGSR
jgi:DNA-binding MarR family transcriptional regulator